MLFISRTYQEMMQEMLAEGWGRSAHKRAERISILASTLQVKSILDYGCGRGMFLKQLEKIKWDGLGEIDFQEYDPCVSSRCKLPVSADLVVCLDVMEHIERKFLDKVILHLWSLTKRFLLVSISLCEADVCLPDGRNAHLIIESKSWWEDRFKTLLKGNEIILDLELSRYHKPEWSFLAIKGL